MSTKANEDWVTDIRAKSIFLLFL